MRNSDHLLQQTILCGSIGGLAMLPVGVVLRLMGQTVNVYGELLLKVLFGRATPLTLLIEHFLISWALAVPWLLFMRLHPAVSAWLIGPSYGAAIWVGLNSLALPLIFGRPTSWQIGWPAIWPSLTVHLIYGLALALAMRLWFWRSAPHQALDNEGR